MNYNNIYNEIKIEFNGIFIYSFYGYYPELEYVKKALNCSGVCSKCEKEKNCFIRCSSCNILLDFRYFYIINELKVKGLLNKDFKQLCCVCYDSLIKS